MPETFIYEIEDPETGTIYEVEGPDGVSEADLFDFVNTQKATEQAQPQTQVAPPGARTPQVAITPQDPVIQPDTSAWRGGPAATTGASVAQRNRPDVENALGNMWAQGMRDPEQYNALLRDMFPGITEDQLMTPETLAIAEARDQWFREHPNEPRTGNFVVNDWTGIVDPERPETMTQEIGQGVQRGLAGMANTATGLAGVAADVVGADETAEDLLDKYVRDSVATQLYYGSSVETAADIESFGDAGRYAAGVIGELLPMMTSSAGAGFIGKAVGQRAAASTVARMVEERVAAGMTREAAEQFAAQTAQRWAQRGLTAGVTAQSVGQEAGSIYGDTYAQTGERAPYMAIASALPAGLLDAILPNSIISQLSSGMRQRFTQRLGREGVEGLLKEGGTEAVQTFLEGLPTAVIRGESPFTEEMFDNMTEAFIRGGIGGGAASTATSMFTGGDTTPPSRNGQFGLAETIYRPTANPRRATRLYPQQLQRTATEMADRVNTLTEGWAERPEITVHPDFKSVDGIDNDALGAYVNGEIILNAENILAEAQATNVSIDDMVAGITFHEALGHHALTREYGDGLNTLLESFYYNGNPEFRNTVDTWMDENPEAYQGDPNREARATEEVLAEMAQNDGQLSVSMIDQIKNYIKDFARRAGINLAVSDREVRAILAVAQRNFVEGREGGQTGDGGTRYMYVGQKANLPNKGDLWEAVDAASYLGVDSGPESQIRDDFGWFQGPDNKWRFEISDDRAFVEGEFNDLSTGSMGLEDALFHPELFRAYPEMKEIQVYRDPTPYDEGNNGTYHAESPPRIYVNSKLDPAQATSTLLHEVQHAIQHLEGFAFGGSPERAIEAMPDDLVIARAGVYRDDVRRIERAKRKELQVLRDLVRLPESLAVSRAIEAFNMSFAPYKQELYTRYEAAMDSLQATLGYDVNHNDPAKDKAFSDLFDVLSDNRGIGTALTEKIDEIKSLSGDLTALDKIFQYSKENQPELLRTLFKDKKRESYQAYRHLFGEIEARDVQGRKNLNASTRRYTTPYTKAGYDVDPEHYILTDGYGNSMASDRSRDELLKKDRRSRVRTEADNTRNEIEAARRAGYDPSEVGLPAKYARKSKGKKEVLTLEDLTAEDLVESRNALSLVDHLVEDIYSKTSFTNDELTQAVLDRGVPPSAIVRRLNVEPGKLTKDMIRYDIAAQKLNSRLSQLYTKMTDGTATQKDRVEFTKTSLALDDVASNLFGLQSEFGRALQAIQRMEYTHKKLTSLREALKGIQQVPDGLYALDDPETFLRYAKGVMDQMQSNTKTMNTTGDKVISALNLPRAIMSSMDLSAPLRQGLYFINRGEFWRSLPAMFRAFTPEKGEAFYKEVMTSIQANPNYDLMMRGNLSLTSIDGPVGKAEEQFASDLAQKIPGVRMSERAYTGFLNKLRADVFSKYVDKMRDAGIDVEDQQTLRALGAWVNAGTGRGNLPKMLEGAAPMLNALFFSPRLISSRLTLLAGALNTGVYGKMPPMLRREIIKQNMAFGTIAVLTLSLISMAIPDAEVEYDPRSSDFGKIKIGNTRYDILGGFSQYFTLGGRLSAYAAGQMGFDVGGDRKTTSGQLVEYSNEYGASNALDAVITFVRNKASPNTSFVLDYLADENAVGEEFQLSDAVISRMLPMVVQDFLEIAEEDGVVAGAAMTAPVIFGVGVNTYTPKALDTEQKLTVQESFSAKDYADSSNEFVVISGGDATLTTAGKNLWTDALNEIFADAMEQRVAEEDWPTLSDAEQAEAIQEVKDESRTAARRYVYDQIGM